MVILVGLREPKYFGGHEHGDGNQASGEQIAPAQKKALALWLQAHVDDGLNDEELMAIAAEGARALDRREAA